jgi:hypothetical protein
MHERQVVVLGDISNAEEGHVVGSLGNYEEEDLGFGHSLPEPN